VSWRDCALSSERRVFHNCRLAIEPVVQGGCARTRDVGDEAGRADCGSVVRLQAWRGPDGLRVLQFWAHVLPMRTETG